MYITDRAKSNVTRDRNYSPVHKPIFLPELFLSLTKKITIYKNTNTINHLNIKPSSPIIPVYPLFNHQIELSITANT